MGGSAESPAGFGRWALGDGLGRWEAHQAERPVGAWAQQGWAAPGGRVSPLKEASSVLVSWGPSLWVIRMLVLPESTGLNRPPQPKHRGRVMD